MKTAIPSNKFVSTPTMNKNWGSGNYTEVLIEMLGAYTGKSGEILECFGFGNETNPKIFSYKPNIEHEDRDTKVQALNIGKERWGARRKVIDGKSYALRLDEKGKATNKLYDLVSFQRARDNPGMGLQAEFVGKIIIQDGKEMLEGI